MKYASLVIAGILAVSSGQLFAAKAPIDSYKDHAQHVHGTRARTFEALDANRDGRLSKAEMAKHPLAAHSAMVDANKDGSLSKDEFLALQGM